MTVEVRTPCGINYGRAKKEDLKEKEIFKAATNKVTKEAFYGRETTMSSVLDLKYLTMII